LPKKYDMLLFLYLLAVAIAHGMRNEVREELISK